MKWNQILWTKWSFLLLGSATMLVGLWLGFRRYIALATWPMVIATVTKSIIRNLENAGRDDETVSNDVQLRFEVGGKTYEVTVNDWGSTGDLARHQAIAARYEVGTR